MIVPLNGVQYLGWISPKILGSDLWAAMEHGLPGERQQRREGDAAAR